MYAIIQASGKQYRVTPGDIISLDRLGGAVGETLKFDQVLLIGGTTDNQVLVGTPFVAQASTHAEIVDHSRGEKLLTIKYKRRKGYRRTIGHRQDLTRVLITKIEDGQGNQILFDTAKRNETLQKASIAQPESDKPMSVETKGTESKEAAPAKKHPAKTTEHKVSAKTKTASHKTTDKKTEHKTAHSGGAAKAAHGTKKK
jgi:large subunit ribosomal protein L21